MQLKTFEDIKIKKRTHCMICGLKQSKALIDLKKLPLTEIYVKKKVSNKLGFVDQAFHFCERCGHGQIANVIDPEVLYGNCYKTRTSTSASATAAVDMFIKFINSILGNKRIGTIVEIGCNDLYMLNKLKCRAEKLYGIDPIFKDKKKSIEDEQIKVIGDFFENINVKDICFKMDVVLSSHTLEHIDDPKKLLKKMLENSSAETLFFFQFPGLESLIKDSHFDQVFHQHLNYFSLKSVIYMLDDVGAELIDYRINPYHYGALMIACKKKKSGGNLNKKFANQVHPISKDYIEQQYRVFKDCMDVTVRRIESIEDGIIYGYGAALMLPLLYYYLGDVLLRLKCIIDEDKNKENMYYLNVPLRIKMLGDIKDIDKSAVVVTAINSMQAIRAITDRLIKMNVRQIILPINLI